MGFQNNAQFLKQLINHFISIYQIVSDNLLWFLIEQNINQNTKIINWYLQKRRNFHLQCDIFGAEPYKEARKWYKQ